MQSNPELERLVETFEVLDDWTERYRYIIDLAKNLPPLPEEARVEANKVQGCMSQVWLVARADDADDADAKVLHFLADSDAQIVKGLIAVLLMMFSGRSVDEIAALDAKAIFGELGLDQHLSVGRRNGLESMVQRIKLLAQNAQS